MSTFRLALLLVMAVGAQGLRASEGVPCHEFARLASLIQSIAQGARPYFPPEIVESFEALMRPGSLSLSFDTVHDPAAQLRSDVRVPAFMERISERLNMPIETVFALLHNFAPRGELTPSMLSDGSVGVRSPVGTRLGTTGGVFAIDVNDGIIRAYQRWMDRIDLRAGISGGQLMEMAHDMLEQRSVPNVSTGQWESVRSVVGLRPSGDSSTVTGVVHASVIARMRAYGIETEVLAGNRSRIRYPEYLAADLNSTDPRIRARHPRGAMDVLAARLNGMLAAGAPPEVIAAFAVQEYLIIHGASGHNGRTARVLGQIIYKKLTGRDIIFPESFHRELHFSLEELASSLFAVPPRSPTPYRNTSVSGLITNLFFHDGLTPTPITGVPQPSSRNSSHLPFGVFSFQGQGPPSGVRGVPPPSLTFQINDHAALPPEIRLRGNHASQGFLFYGRPLAEPRGSGTGQARDQQLVEQSGHVIAQFFANGRRPGEHNAGNSDISSHQMADSRGEYDSRFAQSTAEIGIATTFALTGGRNYGVVFVLDPRAHNASRPETGPQVLDINAFYNWVMGNPRRFPRLARPLNSDPNEREIIWANVLPADVVGAYIVRRDETSNNTALQDPRRASGARVIGFYRNPNYVPR